jgi:rsbT co-antagonist protein RsbR
MSSDSDGAIMMSSEQSAVQSARLRQVLLGIAVVCIASAPFDFVAGLLLQSPALLIAGAIASGMACATAVALALVRRGRLRAAALTIAGGIFTIAVVLALTLPSQTTTIAIMPLLTIALLLPYLPSRLTLALCGVALLVAVTNYLLGALLPPLVAPPPPAIALGLGTFGMASVSALTLLLLWQFSTRLLATVAETRAANAALEQARGALEGTVAARTADLRAALADVQARAAAQAELLDENTQQRAAIREMSVPVLPVSAAAIVIPLIGALDSHRLQMIQEQALRAIERSPTRYVLLDITGVSVVDTNVAQGLLSVVQAARLLGAEVVLVGVRPEVAQTIVTLGLDLRGMLTRQSLQDGIAYTLRDERQIVVAGRTYD